MKKVLIVNTNFYDYTGIVTFIRNYCYYLPKDKAELTFVVFSLHPVFREELERLGLSYYEIPDKKKQPAGYYKELAKILKKRCWDAVHVHGNSAMMSAEMYLAKHYRIPKRIAHAHNTTCDHMTLNRILQPILRSSTTERIACSEDAAKWCFPEQHCHIINNAIDEKRFAFDPEKRKAIRREAGIPEDALVIGHVGYFNEQKNHDYLIDVFAEIRKRNSSAQLVLVGKGDLEQTIDEKAEKLGLTSYIHKLGQRPDTDAVMCAMDCFVFPSKWEGLGIVLIEAQCTGLPCFISDCIPAEATMRNEQVCRLSLESSPENWSDAILGSASDCTDRNEESRKAQEAISQKGYSITVEREKLLKIYLD